MSLLAWLRRVANPSHRKAPRQAARRARSRWDYALPRLEALEDRLAPASTINILAQASGGTLDNTFTTHNGTILASDGGNSVQTLSTGALITATVTDINITAQSAINFPDFGGGGNLALPEMAGHSVLFQTPSTGGAIGFANLGNVLSTAGANITFSAGTNLTTAGLNINMSSATSLITLTAGTAGNNTGNLTLGGSANAGAGHAVLSASSAIFSSSGGANNVTAANVVMTARSGIGSSAAPVQTNVAALAGQTVTGDLFVNNSGDVTVGFAGEPANLFGLQSVGTAGNVSLTAGGNVFVTRNKDIIKGPTSVTVTTTGAGHNLVTGGNNVASGTGAAIQSNGAITLNAGGELLLGDATAHLAGDVQTGGAITLTAGQDVIVDEGTTVNELGTATVTATGNNITLQNTSVNGARIVTHGGAVSLTAGIPGTPPVGGTFTLASGAGGTVSTAFGAQFGPVTVTADFMTINDPISASSNGIVLLQPFTAAQPINLGTVMTGQLGLTDAELKQVTASVLRIGNSANTGGIVLSGAINQAGSGYNALSLITGGSITEAVGGSLTVNRLSLQAGKGIGSAALPLTTGASSIAFTNTSGVVNISNLQALTITGVDTVTTASNNGTTTTVVSSGPLTVALNVTGNDSITLQAQKPTSNPPPTTDLTINSGVTVQSMLNTSAVTLDAADNINVPAGALVSAPALVILMAGLNNPGSTGGINLLGAITVTNVAAGQVTLNAPGDITLSTITLGLVTSPSGTLSVTSTAGNIRDDGNLTTVLAASTYNFTAAKAIGGDAQIGRDDVLLQDANFQGAIDLLPSTDANGIGTATLNINQTGAGGNVLLRDTNGQFHTRMLGTLTLKGSGNQFALIASGVLVPGKTFAGDMVVDSPLTLPALPNDNLLLAGTNGNSVTVGNFSTVTNNGPTAGVTLVTAAGAVTTTANIIAHGPVNLTAAGNSQGNGVNIAFNITAGGPITLDSNRDVIVGGALTTTGAGQAPITVKAAENLPGSVTAGNGVVALRTGSALDTSSSNSDITVQAGEATGKGGDITLETVNAGTGHVTVHTFAGNILNNGDGALNVTGGAVNLSANGFTGINLSVNTTTPAAAGVVAADPNGPITLSDPAGHLQVDNVNAGGNPVSLTAGGATTGIITSLHPNDNVPDVTGTTVTLTALGPSNGATGQIGSFSGGAAQFFEVLSTMLSATTDNSRLWVSSLGGTKIGTVNAGTDVAVLQTVNGDLVSTNTAPTPDITAGTAVLLATVLPSAPPGTTASLGSPAAPLLLAAGTPNAPVILNATVAPGDAGSLNVNGVAGDLKVSQALTASGPVNIGDVGHALTISDPAVPGNAVVGSAGAVVTISADTVTTTNHTPGSPDVQAAIFAVKAKFDVGSAAAPLQTQVNQFTAQGRSVFLNNTGDLALAPAAGITQFAVTGDINITTTGTLSVNQPVQSVGALNLAATTGANAYLIVGAGQSVSSGGAINLAAGNGLVLGGNSALVSRTRGAIGLLAGTKGQGSNSVLAGGLFGGSATVVTGVTGVGSTDILTVDFASGANLSTGLSFRENQGGHGVLSYSDLNGGGRGHFYVLNKTFVERDGANFVFPTNIVSLLVFGSLANDEFLVQGTPDGVTTSLSGSGGVNGFFVSSDAPTCLGDLSGIGGPIFVDPGAQLGNLLVVSEAARPTPDDVTVTSTRLSPSSGAGFSINYPATGFIGGNLKFVAGGGNDVVRVQSTPLAASTSIYTLGGNGTVVVSSARGTLDTISGVLNIDAGTGAAQLIVSEANALIGDSLVLSPNQMYSATYGFVINYTATGGSFSRGVVVTTGQNNDVVTVNGTTAGAYTLINTGPGADQVRVNVSGPSSDPLLIDGGDQGVPAGNALFVTDVAGGGTVTNFPSGPESGLVRVSYVGRGIRDITYVSFDQVFTSP
jgi:filamentous hemagglutinin